MLSKWQPIFRDGKRLTKEHWHKFESEKFAHKICAKNAQNHANTTVGYAYK